MKNALVAAGLLLLLIAASGCATGHAHVHGGCYHHGGYHHGAGGDAGVWLAAFYIAAYVFVEFAHACAHWAH